MPFLPISKQDMKDRGIDQLDFICITGDAYVDHPSFGIAIISRMLESCGCNVGIIAQPVTDEDFKKLGEPKYCFLVTGGNIDSMVSNYTVFKKKRWDDAYSEGGKGGKRPDRAVTVYCKTLTRLFPDKEIAIGGLEASLRRFAHYDYWADKVMPSILVDSGAKLLMYGMGELTIVQLYRELAEGKKLSEIHDIRGTCYLTEPKNTPLGAVQCDSFEIVSENKKAYAKSCRQQYDEQDEVYGKTMVQRHGNMMLVQNPPQRSLTQSEFDKAYELPYMKAYHPCYEKGGGVPGIKEVEFSITHNRGCFGYCNFCSIALHQGRRIQTRSEESVINEAIDLTKKPGFKGYIHDVGGPTANFRRTSCDKQEKAGLCKGKKCLAPEPCPALKVDHSEYLEMLRKIRSIKNVKRVFIRSGIRYDYMMKDKNDEFFKELVEHHVSGQLKVAPEQATRYLILWASLTSRYTRTLKRSFTSTLRNAVRNSIWCRILCHRIPAVPSKRRSSLRCSSKSTTSDPSRCRISIPHPEQYQQLCIIQGLTPILCRRSISPVTRRKRRCKERSCSITKKRISR